MPIFVLLFVFAALVYGVVWSYHAIAAQFGSAVAIGAAVVAAAIVIAFVAHWLRRRRDVARNLHGEGDWTHRVAGAWGEARLAADKRLCEITQGEQHGAYIFADLQGALPQRHANGWHVALRVADARKPLWQLPMPSEREAKRWARVFTLAIAQKL
ncbi:hypothetical protein B0G62_12727 [Paraburkholderia eburnea]|uniref:Uncharacterized protein n=1 Tax=Paraburkholderia eburnea TaxID=1189126 RepID=A0A2S4LUI0_9BURK|nr:hypothetical protein [Paraburkholderia eburnea]POR46045.1 hypothetical protein B0G62_12727 [Paraburkholderia eburnea]PRZ15751.1 hypothetical protein BX588_12543 [Paraburkholderia eburnea]